MPVALDERRRVIRRDGMLPFESDYVQPKGNETVKELTFRFRTVGEIPQTGCVESDAATTLAITEEITIARSRDVVPSVGGAESSCRGSSRPMRGDDYTDLSLLTDGLRSEREQGIIIDAAYRYFATPSRKFNIADAPGHVQYPRNMVTGASTADPGLVLAGARQGLTEQYRRPAVILSLLRVPQLVLAVKKMDLVDYSQEVFDKIHAEFK